MIPEIVNPALDVGRLAGDGSRGVQTQARNKLIAAPFAAAGVASARPVVHDAGVGLVSAMVGAVRSDLANFESAVQGAVAGERSLISVMKAANQAKLCLSVATELRKLMSSMVDKLINMPV